MATATINQTQAAFAQLKASNVMLLTTFRKNGQGVSTPVGINALLDDKVYFTTWSTTYKVKRLANNPHVTVAPSTRMGKPIGATIEGVARQLSDTEWDILQSGKKPSLWGRLWQKIYDLQGRKAVYYVVTAN
ncbi:MAG: PPOX class F420-dependent oxidoreductase [Anaerolineae bacterium]|nr:PPOX class F420-dependent oxidoreductase [Anaerolineae bacterium]